MGGPGGGVGAGRGPGPAGAAQAAGPPTASLSIKAAPKPVLAHEVVTVAGHLDPGAGRPSRPAPAGSWAPPGSPSGSRTPTPTATTACAPAHPCPGTSAARAAGGQRQHPGRLGTADGGSRAPGDQGRRGDLGPHRRRRPRERWLLPRPAGTSRVAAATSRQGLGHPRQRPARRARPLPDERADRCAARWSPCAWSPRRSTGRRPSRRPCTSPSSPMRRRRCSAPSTRSTSACGPAAPPARTSPPRVARL